MGYSAISHIMHGLYTLCIPLIAKVCTLKQVCIENVYRTTISRRISKEWASHVIKIEPMIQRSQRVSQKQLQLQRIMLIIPRDLAQVNHTSNIHMYNSGISTVGHGRGSKKIFTVFYMKCSDARHSETLKGSECR